MGRTSELSRSRELKTQKSRMKMEDCFGGYHQSRVKTASEESMTYNNQHRRLSGMRAGGKKVELPNCHEALTSPEVRSTHHKETAKGEG